MAGPLCGRLLADYGASAIKVERPRGSAAVELHGACSSTFEAEQGITLDIARREDCLRRLVRARYFSPDYLRRSASTTRR
ncbi:CoA transferase [Bradyrhizobium sp. 184]|uniref:CoA transferase n=1 Tax=Bradyrhizobium sp. 184 TaxID=2782653 RepID=UPI0035302C14